MLVGFPLGLLITGVAFDVAYLVTGLPSMTVTAYYMMAVGVVTGVVAEIFGLWDWLYIQKGTRAKRIGAWHGIGNFFAVLLFGISVYLRYATPGFVASSSALWLSVAGAVLLAVTGWLGGELVFTMGEGVDKNAHANAPS